MKHGIIAARGKGKVTKYGSDTKLIRTEHKPCDDDHKPTESSFTGKTGFKMAQDFINKIHHNRMENH